MPWEVELRILHNYESGVGGLRVETRSPNAADFQQQGQESARSAGYEYMAKAFERRGASTIALAKEAAAALASVQRQLRDAELACKQAQLAHDKAANVPAPDLDAIWTARKALGEAEATLRMREETAAPLFAKLADAVRGGITYVAPSAADEASEAFRMEAKKKYAATRARIVAAVGAMGKDIAELISLSEAVSMAQEVGKGAKRHAENVFLELLGPDLYAKVMASKAEPAPTASDRAPLTYANVSRVGY